MCLKECENDDWKNLLVYWKNNAGKAESKIEDLDKNDLKSLTIYQHIASLQSFMSF